MNIVLLDFIRIFLDKLREMDMRICKNNSNNVVISATS